MPSDVTGYPDDFGKLLAGYNSSVESLMKRLEDGKITPEQWHTQMQELLSIYSQSARMLGADISELLPSEQDEISTFLSEQFKYLDGFKSVIASAGGEYSPAWLPRAQMYGAATVTQYWEGKTGDLPLPAQPGQGTQCLGNCKCSWRIVWTDRKAGDADCYWELGKAEHCQTCEVRHEMWYPITIRGGDLIG